MHPGERLTPVTHACRQQPMHLFRQALCPSSPSLSAWVVPHQSCQALVIWPHLFFQVLDCGFSYGHAVHMKIFMERLPASFCSWSFSNKDPTQLITCPLIKSHAIPCLPRLPHIDFNWIRDILKLILVYRKFTRHPHALEREKSQNVLFGDIQRKSEPSENW